MEKKIPKVMADLFVSLKEQWKEEPELLELFKTCYTNTLDTTVKKNGRRHYSCDYRGYSRYVASGFSGAASSLHFPGKGRPGDPGNYSRSGKAPVSVYLYRSLRQCF